MDQTNTVLFLMYSGLAGMILGVASMIAITVLEEKRKRQQVTTITN